MHSAYRLALAAAMTVALTLPLAGVAHAAPKPDPEGAHVPSKAQVDRARAEVETKRRNVAGIQGALAAAQTRAMQVGEAASDAAEAYNGAMWRVEQARKQYRLAQEREKQAKVDVAVQRAGIVSLVTDSYQNGTELNSATAMMSDEGPKGMMNRYAVVQSAGDSMEARYESFRAAVVVAEGLTKKAALAEKRQEALADKARELRESAQAAANSAASAVAQIAMQRQALVAALAQAQNVSVEIAGKRQQALEGLARRKAAAAARARAEEHAKVLRKEAIEAAKKAKVAKQDQKDAKDAAGFGPTGFVGGYAPPIDYGAPGNGSGAKRAVAYALAQLGKPYLWAAEGPDSFDCSGLTMMAWRQGGKSLPHWSVAQFAQGTRISAAQLKPGDLVYWGATPAKIHHVAMYIGNGQIIHAPRTGQPVQINSMYYWVPPDFFARP